MGRFVRPIIVDYQYNSCMKPKKIKRQRVHKTKLWLYCPTKHAPMYRDYMRKRGIKFRQQRGTKKGEVCFVMDRKYRPFQWKINFPSLRRNPVASCPACGAGNKEGRTDCWKCRFELGGGSKPHFGKPLRSMRRPKKRK